MRLSLSGSRDDDDVAQYRVEVQVLQLSVCDVTRHSCEVVMAGLVFLSVD
jgi:hypothetical protein